MSARIRVLITQPPLTSRRASRASRSSRPYRPLSMGRRDYAGFAAFAARLSAREGVRLTITQALTKAVHEYTMRHKLTDQKGAR